MLALALLPLVLATPPAGPHPPSSVPTARAAPASTAPAAPLRVCADPNNLPFSNDRLEGLEDRLAALVARELGRPLEHVWIAQRRGFFRRGLKEGACDAVMGVPAGFDLAATTRPYYRSTWVFAVRKGTAAPSSLDDPRLAAMKVGVQLAGDAEGASPPALALARRGLVTNLRGYSVYGDYRQPNPPARVLDALARGEVDVAVAWGPLAGWWARTAATPVSLRPVTPARDGAVPMTFAIAVGVARGNAALRDAIDAVLARRAGDVARLVDAYGFPRAEGGP